MIRDQEQALEEKLELWRAYQAVFAEVPGQARSTGKLVLEDLARFCHFKSSTMAGTMDDAGRYDPLQMAELEGRRQVYLRIVGLLETTDSELRDLVVGEFEQTGD